LTPSAVIVDYRLEVDEARAARDLPRSELEGIASRAAFYDTFCRYFAPVLADNLVATLDGKELTFHPLGQSFQFTDHLRCDYRFEAPWQPGPGARHPFTFREGNYELDDFSPLRLSLTSVDGIRLLEMTAPAEPLMSRPSAERKPGDGEKLRRATAAFTLAPAEARGSYKPALPPDLGPERRPPRTAFSSAGIKGPPTEAAAEDKRGRESAENNSAEAGSEPHHLLHLLLDTRQGLLVLLLLAAGFGAAHALTPGHGKTLVAAYLVGERGTIWHAIFLGIVVTLTHTAAVLVVAALLPLFFADTPPATVQAAFGLIGGLLIAGLGLWLLLVRLTGRADHVHLGRGPHHHHGGDNPCHHHHHDEVPQTASWGGLVMLGISGGIVPCWDAIAMLGLAISAQRLWLGLPLLLAFSAGLAGVLIALGIGVVSARHLAGKHLDRWQPVVRALPIVSALVVTVLGLWLCYDSVRMGNG
jgi:ABC-type nickel/cobalt efflux system permease component RcnA